MENTLTSEQQRYRKSLEQADAWIQEKNYASFDPYDILGTPLFVFLRSRPWDPISIVASKEESVSPLRTFLKRRLAFFYSSTSSMRLLRLMLGVRKTINPKTMGLLTQGYRAMFDATGDRHYIQKAEKRLEWLMAHKHPDFDEYCWGAPYVWQMVRPHFRIPNHGPQSTMTAVNGLAFLDVFDVTQDERYLDVAKSCCEFFLRYLNVERINDQKISFSYTPHDRTHILNVNLHCGALLSRVGLVTNNDRYFDITRKAANFTIAEQREDGAWHYSSHLDGYVNAVDNTHTGDNLEYLFIIRQYLPDFPNEKALRKGIDYYLAHFFAQDGMPRFTDQVEYPIDIHSCAQSIITLSLVSQFDKACLPVAIRAADWTLKNLRHPEKGFFFYRLYENGKIDKNDFLGTGDAWMVKALALLINAYRLNHPSQGTQGKGNHK